MRTQLLVAVAAAAIAVGTSALEILGVKVPELQKVNVERSPGMPLLHTEAKHLLGMLTMTKFYRLQSDRTSPQ